MDHLMKAPSSCVILQAAGVAAAVAQAGHDQFTRQLRGGAPLAWDALHVPGGGAVVAAHKIAAVAKRGDDRAGLRHDGSGLKERANLPHISDRSALFQLFPPFAEIREIIRKWRFLEESCPLPARRKPRPSGAFWPKKHPGDLHFF